MPSKCTQPNEGTQTVVASSERRRAPRRRLHQPVRVQLFGADADGPPRDAVMLNASPIGMACRVSESRWNGRHWAGQRVRIVFTLDRDIEPFDLVGRVTNSTWAATAGQLVLGMEFESETNGARDRARLRTALTSAARKEERVP